MTLIANVEPSLTHLQYTTNLLMMALAVIVGNSQELCGMGGPVYYWMSWAWLGVIYTGLNHSICIVGGTVFRFSLWLYRGRILYGTFVLSGRDYARAATWGAGNRPSVLWYYECRSLLEEVTCNLTHNQG